MIRLVYLLRRREGLDLAEFQRYWREVHGPIVASFATTLDIAKYVQVHAVEDPINEAIREARGGMEPAYDGVAELWWHSEDAMLEAMGTPAGQAAAEALLEDEAKFIDLPASPLWLNVELPQVNPVGEHLVATPRSPYQKLYFPLRLKAELGFDEGQRYWRTQHGPIIRSQAEAAGILRYQQVHRIASPVEAQLREARGTTVDAYDGHAEVWVDRGVPRATEEARQSNERAVEDESRFIDFDRSTMWFGKELPVIDRTGWL
jgi:uncharacterized protein (TIGR02118 family)